MQIYRSLDEIPDGAFATGTAIAIGKFDGVHLGHQALLAGIAQASARRGLEPVVFTFENNPLSLLSPENCPEPIMSPQQRIDALAEAGVAACIMVPFDARLAAVPAEEFVQRILVDRLRVRYLCVGESFRFGHDGAGDSLMLASAGLRLGFDVDFVAPVEDPELGVISSSRIREAILQGDAATAARMMGHPAAVRGVVVRGDARGRELGFPTANLGAGDGADAEVGGLIPADGVYAGWAVVGGVRYEAAISVGVNLTFEPEGTPRVEAFLLDFSGDIYGERIEMSVAERLRGRVAFAGVDARIERMHEDVRQARAILLGRDA